MAIQENTPQALKSLSEVQNGAKIYRLGAVDNQQIQEAQFWSLENPLFVKGYAKKMGLPENMSSGNDIFVTQATLKLGAPAITRKAPGVGRNAGEKIEVVVNPGDVNVEWFHLVNKKGRP